MAAKECYICRENARRDPVVAVAAEARDQAVTAVQQHALRESQRRAVFACADVIAQCRILKNAMRGGTPLGHIAVARDECVQRLENLINEAAAKAAGHLAQILRDADQRVGPAN